MVVRELELDLDAFEGPFDLLLTLVLREELELADVDLASIVVAFVERLFERDELDLDACGEFLVLIAAQDPRSLGGVLRALGVPPPQVSVDHMALRFPPTSLFLERFRAVLRNRR